MLPDLRKGLNVWPFGGGVACVAPFLIGLALSLGVVVWLDM